MGFLGGLECVFVGHKVAKECQREFLKAPAKKYETRCQRCEYPLELERDESNKKKFYVTEKIGIDIDT